MHQLMSRNKCLLGALHSGHFSEPGQVYKWLQRSQRQLCGTETETAEHVLTSMVETETRQSKLV